MNKDLVSVIVPIYNVENYLAECIESIVNQTYKNIEVLLINDGSKDTSLDVAKKYAKLDNRIILIDKTNTGVSDTRNTGIKKSSGKYIMFVDSDDILDKTCIEKLVNNSGSDSILTICDINRFTKEFSSNMYNLNNYKVSKVEHMDFLKIYRMGLLNSPCGRLYENEVIRNINLLFDSTLSLGEDLLFNLQYLLNVEYINVIEQKLYNYRLGNSSSLGQKYYEKMVNIQERLCDEFSSFFAFVSPKELSKECIKFYITMVSNEFHNKKISFISRHKNAIKILKSKEVKDGIEKYKSALTSVEYFLLKHNFFILYKLLNKFYKNK